MTEKLVDLLVVLLADPDTDADEVAALERKLLEDLLNLAAVETVVRDIVRPGLVGAKGVGLAESVLIVRFASHSDVPRIVVSLVAPLLDGQRLYAAELTLDGDQLTITGSRSVAQRRAVDLWIARHASRD